MSLIYILVKEDENEDAIKIPCEEDGSVLISTLSTEFPGSNGLKYKDAITEKFREVRTADDRLQPPDDGWKSRAYICVFPRNTAIKRKSCENFKNSTKRIKLKSKCSDLIVLGLPWKTTEQEVRRYFEKYGEVSKAQVKMDPKSGQSKGFGFVRFASYESQAKVVSKRHLIDGRQCYVNIPYSKGGLMDLNSKKIFVEKCTQNITAGDLDDYFSTYGEVTDVFIPRPFQAYAIVTFQDPEVARNRRGENHIVKGVWVHVRNAQLRNTTTSYHARRIDKCYSPPYGGVSGDNTLSWNTGTSDVLNRTEIANVTQPGSSLSTSQTFSRKGSKDETITPLTLSIGALNLGAALPSIPAVVTDALGQAGSYLRGTILCNNMSDNNTSDGVNVLNSMPNIFSTQVCGSTEYLNGTEITNVPQLGSNLSMRRTFSNNRSIGVTVTPLTSSIGDMNFGAGPSSSSAVVTHALGQANSYSHGTILCNSNNKSDNITTDAVLMSQTVCQMLSAHQDVEAMNTLKDRRTKTKVRMETICVTMVSKEERLE